MILLENYNHFIWLHMIFPFVLVMTKSNTYIFYKDSVSDVHFSNFLTIKIHLLVNFVNKNKMSGYWRDAQF